MKILFMGTPDFARRSLEALINAGHDICGVITQPDKPVGRKRILTPSPVKEFALSKGLTVHQPQSLRTEEFSELLSSLSPELCAVVAYGKILPRSVLDFPKYGCVNVHGSLLPAYRGAAPIQRAMLDGCKTTGVTTMFMDEGMDTGDMLLKASTEIKEDENLEELYARLGDMGAELLVKTVELIESGDVAPIKQDDSLATYAAKLTRDDESIDFNMPTDLVMRKINCMLPAIGANFILDGKAVKVYSAEAVEDTSLAAAGTVTAVDKRSFTVKTSDGAVKIKEICVVGGKRMPVAAFLCGNKITVDSIIE